MIKNGSRFQTKLFRLLLVVLPVIAVKADPFNPTIPTYNYFYTCASNIVPGCGNGGDNYGDFGMSGDISSDQAGFLQGPINANEFDMVSVYGSNEFGEVIGILSTPLEGKYGVLGFDGHFSLAAFSDDAPGGFYPQPIAINNNGIYLFSDPNTNDGVRETLIDGGELSYYVNGDAIAQQLGLTSECTEDQFAFTGCPASSFWIAGAQGINENNQVAVTLDVFDSLDNMTTVQGVLSPTAVPEPSALIMLATVGLLVTMRHRNGQIKKANRRRKSGWPKRELQRTFYYFRGTPRILSPGLCTRRSFRTPAALG
jgi:hypothetical protein